MCPPAKVEVDEPIAEKPPLALGFRLPPGLEDVVDAKEAEARLHAASPSFLRRFGLGETASLLPSGLLDDPADLEAPTFTPTLTAQATTKFVSSQKGENSAAGRAILEAIQRVPSPSKARRRRGN